MHEFVSDNEVAFSISIHALFEIPPTNITSNAIQLVADLFSVPVNQQLFFNLFDTTIGHLGHPFNADFWSQQLKAVSLVDRDINWSEYVRLKEEQFIKELAEFRQNFDSTILLTPMTQNRLHLMAEYFIWLLTSTVHRLRDKATEALYYYGCKWPEPFFSLVLYSLNINDPYISERLLGAMYGVTLALQEDFDNNHFRNNLLPVWGRKIYELMFQIDAPYSTTHILARDYAKRTIDIALLYQADLLSLEEKEHITPPFTKGGIRKWGRSRDKNHHEYRDGNCPIDLYFT